MKKNVITFLALVIVIISLSSCAHDKTFYININGHDSTIHAETYGWADYEANHNPNINYKASVGNVVWSCLLIECVFPPVILTGWDLYYPVSIKDGAFKSAPTQQCYPKDTIIYKQ